MSGIPLLDTRPIILDSRIVLGSMKLQSVQRVKAARQDITCIPNIYIYIHICICIYIYIYISILYIIYIDLNRTERDVKLLFAPERQREDIISGPSRCEVSEDGRWQRNRVAASIN